MVRSPRQVEALREEEVVDVACGGMHMLALVEKNNTVFGWGQGAHGQLGRGDEVGERQPRRGRGPRRAARSRRRARGGAPSSSS